MCPAGINIMLGHKKTRVWILFLVIMCGKNANNVWGLIIKVGIKRSSEVPLHLSLFYHSIIIMWQKKCLPNLHFLSVIFIVSWDIDNVYILLKCWFVYDSRCGWDLPGSEIVQFLLLWLAGSIYYLMRHK